LRRLLQPAGECRGRESLSERRQRLHRRVELPSAGKHDLVRPCRPHAELTTMNDRIGKYRLIAQLGQGGMATVFLCMVPGPAGVNKLLVVKVLKEELAQDDDFLSMFVNEARLATRLNHANVVATYEVGFEGG